MIEEFKFEPHAGKAARGKDAQLVTCLGLLQTSSPNETRATQEKDGNDDLLRLFRNQNATCKNSRFKILLIKLHTFGKLKIS